MRRDLGVGLHAAGPLLMIATAGSVVSSTLSGWILARVRTGTLLVVSTLIATMALLLFALASRWWHLVAAAALAGGGGGAVDAALNGFVARSFSARHMSWLHGFYGVGATLGPLTASVALVAERSWRAAYATLAALEGAVAIALLLTIRRWPAAVRVDKAAERGRTALTGPMRAGVAFFFLYGALEASAGLWGASYLIAAKGVAVPVAGAAVSAYWGALTAGRFVTGALASSLGEARLVRIALGTAVVALLGLLVPGTPPALAIAALALLGFALAPVYPMLMHLTPRRHGEEASMHLVGYQVAACSAGIALLPMLVGALAQRTSLLALPPALLVLAGLLVVVNRRAARS